MKAEANTQARVPAAAEGRSNAPVAPVTLLGERDAAQRFAGLIAGKGQAAAKDGKENRAKSPLLPAAKPKEDAPLSSPRGRAEKAQEQPAFGVEPALAATAGARSAESRPLDKEEPTGLQAPAPREAAVAPISAPPSSTAADPADAAAFSQALDRILADQRASSETQLTLPDGRWAAQAARIATAPDGAGVSLSLDLQQGEQHDQAATRELRRRLEARGIRVASIEAR